MAPPASTHVLPAYQAHEKVFCFHLELMYEAKILGEPKRKDPNDPTSPWMYLVHYRGWKTTWDDWVSEDRLRKLTEDNRELAASLRRDVMQTESRARNPKPVTASKKGRTQGSEIGSGRGSEERNSSVPTGGRGAKRGKDNEIEKVAIPEFSTPRRSARLQSIALAQSTLPDSPDPVPSGSDQDAEVENQDDEVETQDDEMETQDDEMETQDSELPSLFNFGSPVAFTANKEESSNFQDAPARGSPVASTANKDRLSKPQDAPTRGFSVASTVNEEVPSNRRDTSTRKAAGSDKRIKSMALRKIHSQYDEDSMKSYPLDFSEGKNNLDLALDEIQESIPMKDDVLARRGYFAGGQFQSPALETETKARRRPGMRVSRQAEQSVYQSEQPPPGPDAEPAVGDVLFEMAMKALSEPPPPDEPEHMTADTFHKGQHWAPLIGGTAQNDKQQIEDQAQNVGAFTPKKPPHHPEYIKTGVNDPLNANRLHFFKDQDPNRILTSAGMSKEPNTHVDPPGSGLRYDALKYPEYLLQYGPDVLGNLKTANLKKLSRDTIVRFPNAALRKLPRKYLKKLKIPVPTEADDPHQEESFYSRPSVHIPMPDMIKGYLVDDWENVTKNLFLVGLPSLCPVNWILDDYYYRERDKRREGSEEATRFREFCAGMQTYFSKMIGKTLLYKFERVQYAELTKLWEEGQGAWKGKGPGDCYGAEHLCRLIVGMPEYMARTDMTRQHVNQVKEELTLLMQWMCRNYQRIFINKYEGPTAEYIEAARD